MASRKYIKSEKSRKLEKEISYDAIVFFKLTKNNDFQQQINILRKKYGINIYNLVDSVIPSAEELDNEDDIFEYLINDFSLQNDVFDLLEKFNLSEDWYNAVSNYLILDEKFKPDGIQVIHRLKERDVVIKLGKDSTLQEIISRWPLIQKKLDSNNRKKKWENFRRDLCIYNEYKKGKTTDEIYTFIKKYFNEDLEYWVIQNSISKYKKRMNID